MLNEIAAYLARPALDEPTLVKFWDDEHISKGMLEAHLDPEWDAASRKHTFLDASADWIASIAPPARYPALIDLGCGPGLYAERFHVRGYTVLGVDYSHRSLAYAQDQAQKNGHAICYRYQNYVQLDEEAAFDVATLIYCDYGVLPAPARRDLLGRIYRALKPGGKFIVDVCAPEEYADKPETTNWQYHPDGGFWSPNPHLCLYGRYRYDDACAVVDHYVIVEEASVRYFNNWQHYFTPESLCAEMQSAGFHAPQIYDDMAGAPYHPASPTFCLVIEK
jgi:SAM-dependent methyltransferase